VPPHKVRGGPGSHTNKANACTLCNSYLGKNTPYLALNLKLLARIDA
jgi:hypothetical protein